MCGLLGAISTTLSSSDRDLVADLFYINAFRGQDSTGMFDYVKHPKKGEPKTVFWKTVTHPADFIYDDFISAESGRWKKCAPSLIAGHTRAATVGKVTDKNAHPFVFSKIIGMHNGTVYGKFPNKENFETDSEALLNNINDYGIDEALAPLKEFSTAAWALVWFVLDENKLYFARNKERPLHCMIHAGTFFWSSDFASLSLVAKKHRVTKPKIEYFDENFLYYIDINDPTKLIKSRELPHYKTSTYSSSGLYGEYGEYHTGWYNRQSSVSQDSALRSSGGNLRGTLMRDLNDVLANTQGHKTASADTFDEPSRRWGTIFQVRRLERLREEIAEIDKKAAASHAKCDETDVDKKEVGTSIVPFVPDLKYDHKFGPPGREELCTRLAYLEKIKVGCLFCGDPATENEIILWVNKKEFLCSGCTDEATSEDHQIHGMGIGMSHAEIVEFVQEKYGYTPDKRSVG